MSNSRTRAIKLNMLTGWAQELFTLISGLILPRLMLLSFGSEANGLVNSIAQYLSFSTLLRAGLGGVTRAALYKPLAEKDMDKVSSIMVATQDYMRKIAAIIVGYVLVVAVGYPFIAKGDFDWSYMFLMVLVLGGGSVTENLWGIQSKILLQADQKLYVQILFALISQIAGFVISVVLIYANASLMLIKITVALSSVLGRVLLYWYVRKRYKLNMKASPNTLALKQRWDAFAHQVAVVVNDNVDLFLLTLFVNLKEISVYTIHNMVVLNIRKVVEACISGITSTFGDMLAKEEKDTLNKSFKFVEWAFFSVCVVLFSVTAVMLTPFIRLYTDSVTDVNYIRPMFAVAMTLVGLMGCMRRPYQAVTEAAGHFKQTRNGAIFEVILNVIVSLVMLYKFGIIGVIIGTFAAAAVRTIQYSFYSYKNILHISRWLLLRTYGVYMGTFVLIVGVAFVVGIPQCDSWLSWMLTACVVTLLAALVVLLVSLFNNREQLNMVFGRIKNKLCRG